MNIKQKLLLLFAGTTLAFSAVVFSAPLALAQGEDKGCEVKTAIIACENVSDDAKSVEETGLWSILVLAINVLTGLVGVAALGGIVYGSILYTSAGGNPEQTKKAMGIISNVVIGIIAYALMYVGLNFLVPGGIFR